MLDVLHTGLCSHNGMPNVADSLIVVKTMQLCWTFITWDCVHTMECKTLLTLWLLWRQCSFAGHSSHGILFTQWDAKRCSLYGGRSSQVIVFTQWEAKRCWLSNCSEDNAAMLNVHHTGLCSHSGIQNVAKSLIVMKTMQLCFTFITRDCIHTTECKMLLTVWLWWIQCRYAGRSLHWIVFTQWNGKR